MFWGVIWLVSFVSLGVGIHQAPDHTIRGKVPALVFVAFLLSGLVLALNAL